MSVTLNLPPTAESAFRRIWGDQLDRKAFEALLVEGYRSGALSRYQVQQMLGLDNRWDAEEWLGARGVDLNYSLDDLRADRQTLSKILSKS